MFEFYDIVYQNGKVDFILSENKIHAGASGQFSGENLLEDGWIAFCHLGDPEVMQCSVYRKRKQPGGLFVLQALEPLFMAQTNSNLIFSLACGHFAQLVSDIRYGMDIWEDMDGSDA